MNRSKYAKILFCLCLLTIGVLESPAPSQLAQSNPAQNSVPDVGRENPFAAIPKAIKPLPQSAIGGVQPSQLVEETPELFLETITLKFLDAEKLKSVIEKMLSAYGSVSANTENNSLVICDTKERVTKILAEIRKADKSPQQIMIEAVIVDVQLKDDTEIGVNWDILSPKNYDIAYRQNFTTRLGSTKEDADTIGSASAFVTTGTGGDFTLISGTIRNVVHMLQQKKDVEILASPKIMVLSGQSASIELVEEIPYRQLTQTAEAGAMSSVEFKQVGVKMSVTATLTDGNDIILKVGPEQNINTSVFGIENIPIIDTRKAQTTLLLKDGQVVIMGGLRRKEKTKSRDQIPILGDLPLIGFLFGKDKVVIKHTELLLFLSPHIYKGEPLSEEEMRRYSEIRDRPMLSVPGEHEKQKEDRLEPVDQ